MYQKIFNKFYDSYGPQGWWPISGKNRTGKAEDRPLHVPKHHNGPPKTENDILEIMLGAILTQNTNWKNVEKAIENLSKNNLINQEKLQQIPQNALAEFIRSAGYYNQKAKSIKNQIHFLEDNPIEDLKSKKLEDLRKILLDIKGIGPETADSILLYAFQKPSFVVDAYTKRIFSRIGIIIADDSYDQVKQAFETGLKQDVTLFKEYHALIVEHGKNVCKTHPTCETCILAHDCAFARKHLNTKTK
ncbi:MAG: endonuclease [Nanoarchaeota archaeon]|nr:endonuclease [Nanoarchaeota archaeon]